MVGVRLSDKRGLAVFCFLQPTVIVNMVYLTVVWQEKLDSFLSFFYRSVLMIVSMVGVTAALQERLGFLFPLCTVHC